MVAYIQSGAYADCLVAVVQPRNRRVPEVSRANTPLTLLHKDERLEIGFSLTRLSERLSRRVPAYMMPATWFTVNDILLTDSKKIDRRGVYDWLVKLPRNDNTNSPVAAANKLALEISEKASSIIANNNQQVFDSLNGRSFDLTAAGLNSIQVVTLSRWIRDFYGSRIPVQQLTRPGLTITGLARVIKSFQEGCGLDKLLLSPGLNTKDEVDVLAKNFDRPQSPKFIASTAPKAVSSVLLTGANGFLGIEILRQLLCEETIQRLYVLVRAESVEHGRQRILGAAKAAFWTLPPSIFDHRVQVWLGDLSQPKLGLSDEQWGRWIGKCEPTQSLIDLVIHNGATVQWNLGYESLKRSNVLSTRQLLDAMVERPVGGRFVYISGGQTLTNANKDDEAVGNGGHDGRTGLAGLKSAEMTGYSQTKIVSELLVQRCALSERGRGHVVRVVKPSYIIGDEHRGIANPSDYIWRLAKAVVEMREYNADTCHDWLFISDVVTVAQVVCRISVANETEPLMNEILDGVSMQQFWDALAEESGYSLGAVSGGDFWPRLQTFVETAGDRHDLWALQDILTPEIGEIASMAAVPTKMMTASSPGVLRAIRSNLRYLREVMNFLPVASSTRPKL